MPTHGRINVMDLAVFIRADAHARITTGLAFLIEVDRAQLQLATPVEGSPSPIPTRLLAVHLTHPSDRQFFTATVKQRRR